MSENLKSAFASLVEAKARQMLHEMLGTDEKETDISTEEAIRNIDRSLADTDDYQPRRRARKRGRGRAKVAYVVTKYGAKQRQGQINAMIPTWARTFAAIRKAAGPVTAYELEKATGMPKKTIESSVFNLRQLNMIVSRPVKRQIV